MTDDVLPDPALLEPGAAALKVQATSKLAFGATTAALVTLASSGTAVLVSHGAASLQAPTALPPTATLTDPAAARGAVVVDRAPGTWGQVEAPAGLPTAPPADPSVTALSEALARRPEPGRRTLTVPLVALPVETPALPVDVPVDVPADVPVVPPVEPVALPTTGNGRTPTTPVPGKKDERTVVRAAQIRAQLKAAEREEKRLKEAAHRAKEAEKRAKEAAKHAAEKAQKPAHKGKAKHSR